MFKVGNTHSKNNIYRILNVPSELQKGAWDTGYRKYEDAFYVFANIYNTPTSPLPPLFYNAFSFLILSVKANYIEAISEDIFLNSLLKKDLL